MKYLFFALLTAASAFTSCNDSAPDPTPNEPCVTCENETIVDSLFEYEAVVKKHMHDPTSTPKYILSISQKDLTSGESYTIANDSLFLPCPALSQEYQEIGLRVKITGYTKSCTNVIGDAETRPFYGRKLELIEIKKY
ncbi:hypothetical protein [Bernardetia sp. MNP-M8]|uniref:hypothetical protein n=1 Tax=Bernardetia sp. MNP-M8 TaxID=3127470 RepID=UPI0030CC41AC